MALTRLRHVSVVGLTCLALAGCGSGNKTTSSNSPPTTSTTKTSVELSTSTTVAKSYVRSGATTTSQPTTGAADGCPLTADQVATALDVNLTQEPGGQAGIICSFADLQALTLKQAFGFGGSEMAPEVAVE